MSSHLQARGGMLTLGLLLLLSGSCQFTEAGDDVLFACTPNGNCGSSDQICSRQSLCIPRNQAIRIVEPQNNTLVSGPIQVVVALDVAGVDPDTLVMTITFQGEGPTNISVRRQEPGRYVVRWTPSRGDGEYQLRVSAPDEGLSSAPVTVVLDTDESSLIEEAPAPAGPPWR